MKCLNCSLHKRLGMTTVVPSDVTGMAIYGVPSEEKRTTGSDLTISSRVIKRPKPKKCIGNLVTLPDLHDYTVCGIDPGTSSQAVRIERLVDGVCEEVFELDVLSYKTDSTLIETMAEDMRIILSIYKIDLAVIEKQLGKFLDTSLTAYMCLATVCRLAGIPLVILHPRSRFNLYDINTGTRAEKKKKIAELGQQMLRDEGDEKSLQIIESVKGRTAANGTKVSKGKIVSDMSDTITIIRCAHDLLALACE